MHRRRLPVAARVMRAAIQREAVRDGAVLQLSAESQHGDALRVAAHC